MVDIDFYVDHQWQCTVKYIGMHPNFSHFMHETYFLLVVLIISAKDECDFHIIQKKKKKDSN